MGEKKKVGVYVQPVLYGEQVCKHGVCMNELNEVFFLSPKLDQRFLFCCRAIAGKRETNC